jgi:hypothetical protein
MLTAKDVLQTCRHVENAHVTSSFFIQKITVDENRRRHWLRHKAADSQRTEGEEGPETYIITYVNDNGRFLITNLSRKPHEREKQYDESIEDTTIRRSLIMIAFLLPPRGAVQHGNCTCPPCHRTKTRGGAVELSEAHTDPRCPTPVRIQATGKAMPIVTPPPPSSPSRRGPK